VEADVRRCERFIFQGSTSLDARGPCATGRRRKLAVISDLDDTDTRDYWREVLAADAVV
jgi:hypothetical protein